MLSLLLRAMLLQTFVGSVLATQCKTTPMDDDWPGINERQALNESINGTLLSTTPAPSSCYAGNPFGSPFDCNFTISNWTSGIFHASLPESIGSPLFANNSCIPPGAHGYRESAGCHLGGLPSYIVNATTNEQVATAAAWAAERNIRIVVKGTGHDLNGRSSGAYALSIWTHHLRQLRRDTHWKLPGNNKTEDVFVIGSGLEWSDILKFALSQGRVVTTGQDGSVGPGGYIQGGGHGPLASTYGLGAQQALQATVVTTTGEVLITKSAQNQDLFWAIRGGGGGQYGIVTEFVIKHHPEPEAVAFGTLSIVPQGEGAANASWDALALHLSLLPDLMDAGIAGAMTLAAGETAGKFNPAATDIGSGVVVTQALWAIGMTAAQMDDLINPVVDQLRFQSGNANLTVQYQASTMDNYTSFYSGISGSNVAGGGSVMTSRLLGRKELVDVPRDELRQYIERGVAAQNSTAGTFATVGLSGGPGVISSPADSWGALHSAWRSAYLHFYVGGESLTVEEAANPQDFLEKTAVWIDQNKECLWREWAPSSGSYMNEGNPYSKNFKADFYGDNYERLLGVKRK
ncbi:hypothetical protein CBER1_04209 [Cercospora berteroae]|uniref:FAD-binding PCMH-type domain-containing protein n=1 Tax=Cercospora berteroae TaxID=357750 RepID=A0A2S6CHU6_9PEZI|nr:hypothetical protein CBER1_04209 [Cercospora berteroae]